MFSIMEVSLVNLLTDAPVPEQAENIEMDELYTFIGEKKTGST